MVDGARDFRLMRRPMVDAILELSEYNRFSKGIFAWVGFETEYLEYKNVERVAGETSWNFWSLFKYSIEGIVNFSDAPLNIAFIGGLLSWILAFIMVIPVSYTHLDVYKRQVFEAFQNDLAVFDIDITGERYSLNTTVL